MSRRDEARLEALKASLVALGPFRRGSVQRRFMPCGRPTCACQATPPKLHGPYYEWTRKVAGKTVSVRLSPEQAKLVRQWNANARQLRKLLAEMERVSMRLTEPLLKAAAPSRPARRAARRQVRGAPRATPKNGET